MRTALRVTTTALALFGAAIVAPATAFAAPAPAPAQQDSPARTLVVAENCVKSQVIPSLFDGLTVKLTNSAHTGATAQLRDESGKVLGTVDQSKPLDLANGLRIDGVLSTAPVFKQRTQGGDAPWTATAFPKLPKDCNTAGSLYSTTKFGSLTVKTYKAGPQLFSSYIVENGKRVGFLHPAPNAYQDVRKVGDRYVRLTVDGEIHSWTGATTVSPKLGVYSVAGGTKVRLVKKDGLYGVQMTSRGTWSNWTYFAKGKPVILQSDNTIVVLNANGTLSNFVYGIARQTAPVWNRA
ncbi:hypothetical protein OHA37_38120 [Streptomyces sp. NBC_00335]|uniref:hypothetical protein n=1 Tax=unclassified Streptomyces TaxID=2593676 RepID=UPI00225061DE|nr:MULTISPECIES: hypothetical protein [unclassified Streptomyces]MCX5409663.1 hypothetical protein [Streptomyces sp. NBC_00086]